MVQKQPGKLLLRRLIGRIVAPVHQLLASRLDQTLHVLRRFAADELARPIQDAGIASKALGQIEPLRQRHILKIALLGLPPVPEFTQ